MSSETDFWLLPEGLEQQAGVIDQWCREFGTINASLAKVILEGEPGAGIYNHAMEQAATLHTAILRWMAHMQNVLESVSTELRHVAVVGRSMDLEAAARLDKYDPSEYNWFSRKPLDGSDPDAGSLTPPEYRYDEPTAPVFPPSASMSGSYLDAGPGAFRGTNEFTNGLFPEDLMSPTGWIRTVLQQIGALSYRQQILNAFGGDWSVLRWYAHKIDGLSKFLFDVHSSLIPTIGSVLIYWQGYSANSAAAYFRVMLDGIEEAVKGSVAFSDALNEYVDAVMSFADYLGGEIEALCDTVIFAAVAQALGKKSVIGWALGEGAAAVAIGEAMRIWSRIRDVFQTMEKLYYLLMALRAFNADLDDFITDLKVPYMVETS
ncbi:hypothetical protein [Mycetocola spongiae]|uniref:hypothetical protein n=1 Tax=Mycetocola spongiae TaxID=2859226 RepID=UPI001CF42C43|nr:hypothetical protein [Mycetocola spongiae]UCR88615.1 hypothetical protein KXZ72_11705 [Mycetocola spongiae]